MGGSIETFEFKKIECESKYDLNLKKNGINKISLPKEIFKLYSKKIKDRPYDDSIKSLEKNISYYNQSIDKVEKLINDYNKINKKNKSSKNK